jgi:hypothetical protein
MACRSWVRHTLPSVQSHSPRPLDARAESGLEQETCNEKTRVVRGDGVETRSDARDVKHEATEDPGHGQNEDEGHSSQDEEPSWQRLRSPWPSPPPSDGEEETGSSLPSVQNRGPLRRIHSAASSFKPLDHTPTSSNRPGPTTPRPSSPRNHRRTPSATFHMNRSRNSTLSIASASQVPRPAIRRAASSHPDISVLCQSWYQGPANQTTTYRSELNHLQVHTPNPSAKFTAG